MPKGEHSYWVLFEIKGHKRESIVEVPAVTELALPQTLRSAVWPDKPGDPSDGMTVQRTADCVLLNWKSLG